MLSGILAGTITISRYFEANVLTRIASYSTFHSCDVGETHLHRTCDAIQRGFRPVEKYQWRKIIEFYDFSIEYRFLRKSFSLVLDIIAVTGVVRLSGCETREQQCAPQRDRFSFHLKQKTVVLR